MHIELYQIVIAKVFASSAYPSITKSLGDSIAAGKISNDQYTHLKTEISIAFQEIFKKRIESLTNPNIEAFSKIKRDIKDAYANGKINQLHYDLLNKQMSEILGDK